MVDLLLLLQQASAEEADKWTGKREGKGEEVPQSEKSMKSEPFMHGRMLGQRRHGMSIQMEPKLVPAEEGKKGNRTINEDLLDGGPRMDRKIFLETIPEKEDLVFWGVSRRTRNKMIS